MTPRPHRRRVHVADGIEAEVTFKDVKHLRMRIVPPGEVRVSVPYGTSAATLRRFLDGHHEWLQHHLHRLRTTAGGGTDLDDGGRAPLWGQWLPVRVSAGRRSSAVLRDGALWLTVDPRTPGGAHAALDALYRRELGPAVSEHLSRWAPRVGRSAARVRLRRMTSRWGSCNHRTGAMTFNLALAAHPPEALEYVVVHEMVHLLVPGHGPDFRARMDELLPDWRARRRSLRGSA